MNPGYLSLALINKILPIGVFMSFPLLVLQAAGATSDAVPFNAFEMQGWFITAIAFAMGLVRIALWLKGSKENGNGTKDIASLQTILTNQATMLNKLIENDGRITEMMAVQRVIIQNQEQSMRQHIEQVASNSINDLKDFLREEKNDR